MAPADKDISNITLHFCPLKKRHCHEHPAVRGGYGYIMVKLVGCKLVVGCAFENLLSVNNLSKKALILGKKKSILYSILCTQNIPTLHSNTPPKMGCLRCASRGINITGTYPRSRNL
jgi:hypothetical protein